MKKTILNLRKMGFVLVAATGMLAFSCGGDEAAQDATDAIENLGDQLNDALEDVNDAADEAMENACDAAEVVDSIADMACDGACDGADGAEHACDHGE